MNFGNVSNSVAYTTTTRTQFSLLILPLLGRIAHNMKMQAVAIDIVMHSGLYVCLSVGHISEPYKTE